MLASLLRDHVDGLVAVQRIGDEREREALGIGRRESGVPSTAPLHRGPDAVAIAEVDVVAHADLVAVVEDRAARQRHQQSVQQLHAAPITLE